MPTARKQRLQVFFQLEEPAAGYGMLDADANPDAQNAERYRVVRHLSLLLA